MIKKIVLGIVIYKKKILIVRRKVKEGNLFWQFPGGEIESNETEEQAVIRELKEETGLSCKANKLLGKRVHPHTNREMLYFACNFISGEILISDEDLSEAKWVNIENLNDYFTTDLYEPVKVYINGNK